MLWNPHVRVFLSYADEQRVIAGQVRAALSNEGVETFFDRDALGPGDSYHGTIRRAILRSHVFVFLISRESIAPGSYALSELQIAAEVGKRGRVRLLPVLVEHIPFEGLPPEVSEVTVLEPRGDVPAEVAALVASVRSRRRRITLLRLAAAVSVVGLATVFGSRLDFSGLRGTEGTNRSKVAEDERVRLISMATNQGWMVSFDIAEPHIREILYRLDGVGDFQSTGLQEVRDRVTGHPQPKGQIMLAGAPRPHEIAVKYVDADGREHGPYELRFDPKTAFVNETKRILEMVRWVEFREYPAGRLLAYFSSLVSRRNAFQEIRYSVDDESLDRSVHFRADWTAVGMPRISDGDETYVEIPMSTQFVAIKLFFIDGTESELKRIVLSEVGVRR